MQFVAAGRGAVQCELAKLVRTGLVTRAGVGNCMVYQANKGSPVFKELRALIEKTSQREVDEMILREMVRRIREVVAPERIILFGSRARDEAQTDSDSDLLIIASPALPRWQRIR